MTRWSTHVGDGAEFGVRARFLADGDVLLGTGGAIRRALPELPDAFWVTYGDSLLRVDIGAAETAFARSQDVALMTVWHNRNTLGPSNALVRDGVVVEYSKQPPPAGAEHIDYGMLLLTRAAFAATPPDEAFDLAVVLSELAARVVSVPSQSPSASTRSVTRPRSRETDAELRRRAR